MTKSIPINKNHQRTLEEEDEQRHIDMLADYRDYLFYSRVVEGMRRVQDHTRDIALRYENQAVIDHVVRTRHCQGSAFPNVLSSSPTSVRNFGDDSTSSNSSRTGLVPPRVRSRVDLRISEDMHLCQDDPLDEQDFIFDMDL